MKTNNFQDTIKAYLDQRAKEDSLFTVTYAKENKNIEECCAYIMGKALKSSFDISKGVKCAPMSRDEAFNLAIHYYDEDDIKVEKTTASHVAVSASTPKKVEAPKAKVKKEYVGQLSLF